MDKNTILNNQISEFLRVHKTRFTQINPSIQFGKIGYQTQLNIPGINSNLLM